MPVTIKQLFKATQAHPDDGFKVDGKELSQVPKYLQLLIILQLTLVGIIMNIQEQSTNINFVIDDSTGKIEVRFWVDAEVDGNNEFSNRNRSQWRY
jgi:replication factor A2